MDDETPRPIAVLSVTDMGWWHNTSEGMESVKVAWELGSRCPVVRLISPVCFEINIHK